MKQVIVFPRGQLTRSDKARMEKVDIVAVEADDPSKVVSAIPVGALVGSDDLLMAAITAISRSTYSETSIRFASEFMRRLLLREEAKK